uniref:Uncharacterized protein n=1 Tax=Rhizophora mucronata TaxID=61149 RepID=A0A2P2N1B0_RHIMU
MGMANLVLLCHVLVEPNTRQRLILVKHKT